MLFFNSKSNTRTIGLSSCYHGNYAPDIDKFSSPRLVLHLPHLRVSDLSNYFIHVYIYIYISRYISFVSLTLRTQLSAFCFFRKILPRGFVRFVQTIDSCGKNRKILSCNLIQREKKNNQFYRCFVESSLISEVYLGRMWQNFFLLPARVWFRKLYCNRIK